MTITRGDLTSPGPLQKSVYSLTRRSQQVMRLLYGYATLRIGAWEPMRFAIPPQFDTETETSVTCRDAQRAQVATVRVRIEFKTKLRARSYNKMASRHTLGAFFSYRYESAYPRALSGGMRQRVGFVIRICNLLCLVDGRCNVSISLAPPAILGKTKDLGDDDRLPRTTIDAPDPMYASGIGVQVPLESLSMIPPGLSASIRASRQCPSLRARAA